jgi:hypothetical protein
MDSFIVDPDASEDLLDLSYSDTITSTSKTHIPDSIDLEELEHELEVEIAELVQYDKDYPLDATMPGDESRDECASICDGTRTPPSHTKSPSKLISSLARTVDNLRDGFHAREIDLKQKLQAQKSIVLSLFGTETDVRENLKAVCEELCDDLGLIEAIVNEEEGKEESTVMEKEDGKF